LTSKKTQDKTAGLIANTSMHDLIVRTVYDISLTHLLEHGRWIDGAGA